MNDLNTTVSVGNSSRHGQLGNLTLQDAKFFGRPNFSGEMDRFKDDRKKFTVRIPNETADELRALGWNVRTILPETEEQETISCLKVMVDPGSCDVYLIMGDKNEKLEPNNLGIVDRTRFDVIDMEIRAWMYNEEEVRAGQEQPMYSARLVKLIGVIQASPLNEKYGIL